MFAVGMMAADLAESSNLVCSDPSDPDLLVDCLLRPACCLDHQKQQCDLPPRPPRETKRRRRARVQLTWQM
jgi:hypothetical protein